jgi:hypothetical protein
MTYPHTSADCGEYHDLVRDFGGPRPEIIVLCGSTRFAEEFRAAEVRLAAAGNIVLSIERGAKGDAAYAAAGEDGARLKAKHIELHQRKIDLADWVYVLDVATPECPGGYIGESTQAEIYYAAKVGKPVRYLSADVQAVR